MLISAVREATGASRIPHGLFRARDSCDGTWTDLRPEFQLSDTARGRVARIAGLLEQQLPLLHVPGDSFPLACIGPRLVQASKSLPLQALSRSCAAHPEAATTQHRGPTN